MRTYWHIKLLILLIFSFSHIKTVFAIYYPCTTIFGTDGICTTIDECFMNGKKGFDCPNSLVCCPKIIQSKEIRLRQDETCKSKIHKGDSIQDNKYPWMVLLRYHDTIKEEYFYGCIGTLISSSLIVTAAHCITGLNIGVKLSGVRMGVSDSGIECPFNATNDIKEGCDKIQDFLVMYAWYPNEGDIVYQKDKNGSLHDIGFLVIRRAIKFTEVVIPVCIFNVPVKTDEAKLMTSGWNVHLSDGIDINKLIMVEKTAKILNSSLCETVFKTGLNESNQVCIEEEMDEDCADKSESILHLIKNEKISVHAISSYEQENCVNGVKLKIFTVLQPYIHLMQEKSKELGIDDFPLTMVEVV